MGRRTGTSENWLERTYGRKGGTSATAGRSGATYRVRFPDGTSIEKRAFKAFQPEALAYIYQHEGRWHCAAVYDAAAEKMKNYQTAPAERVR